MTSWKSILFGRRDETKKSKPSGFVRNFYDTEETMERLFDSSTAGETSQAHLFAKFYHHRKVVLIDNFLNEGSMYHIQIVY
ncbi:uncharacterized protein EAF02_007109 [Botrytis sinoallii]|uniref:uncharacterized protein n=1 Tax=Botrytis sinoallii TaxID=1463999 RepID=UPI0019011C86|nr:uncharacterized protein EAF02_007109 [Botrytis sinoallii]KAF7881218.1 hypothetical protein EAF02_007109 [Botrytis sinoallii]